MIPTADGDESPEGDDVVVAAGELRWVVFQTWI
jgi:hypothetical protein